MPAIMVSLSILAVISTVTAETVPNFNRFAEQSAHETASAPIPDPVVGATLKDIQLPLIAPAKAREGGPGAGPVLRRVHLCFRIGVTRITPSGPPLKGWRPCHRVNCANRSVA